jgi:molybdate transport system substrate-binding protein
MTITSKSLIQSTVGARRALSDKKTLFAKAFTLLRMKSEINAVNGWAITSIAPTKKHCSVECEPFLTLKLHLTSWVACIYNKIPKTIVLFCLFTILFFARLTQAVHAQDKILTVFAASSLTESFTQIGAGFLKQTGITVRFQFAGSQILKTQLENGAQADLLATAEPSLNAQLEQRNILEKSQIFTRNRLIVITPKRGLARVKTLADLAAPNIKLIIAQANVPIGVYTRQVLQKLENSQRYGTDFAARVLKNVVSEESNVRQVSLKVRLGEADAGIVYVTDVTPEIRSSLIQIAIPERQNVIAQYPIGVVRQSKNLVAAREFMQYVLSPAGQGILQTWGFLKKP